MGRFAQNQTLCYGWISLIVVWFFPLLLIRNAWHLHKLRTLGDPHVIPERSWDEGSQYDPGRPVFKRVGIIFGMLIALPVTAFWLLGLGVTVYSELLSSP